MEWPHITMLVISVFFIGWRGGYSSAYEDMKKWEKERKSK